MGHAIDFPLDAYLKHRFGELTGRWKLEQRSQSGRLFVIRNTFSTGKSWLCGYAARLTKDVKLAPDAIDVHGGVTYEATWNDGHNEWTIYGFDCAHAMDEEDARWQDPRRVIFEAKEIYSQMRRHKL